MTLARVRRPVAAPEWAALHRGETAIAAVVRDGVAAPERAALIEAIAWPGVPAGRVAAPERAALHRGAFPRRYGSA